MTDLNNYAKLGLDHGRPYTAEPSGGANDWWYVADIIGYNCLQIVGRPGAKFTTQAIANAVAAKWNAQ